MTTLVIRGNSAQSRSFLEYARTLPYVEVAEEGSEHFTHKLKPEVENAILKSEREEELVVCENVDDMFEKLGLQYVKTRIQ